MLQPASRVMTDSSRYGKVPTSGYEAVPVPAHVPTRRSQTVSLSITALLDTRLSPFADLSLERLPASILGRVEAGLQGWFLCVELRQLGDGAVELGVGALGEV